VPIALIARHVAEERSGFVIASHHTVFAGTCPSCRRAGRTGGQADRRTET
jgi:Fe2+ or Zn2+ uptake regulation protein